MCSPLPSRSTDAGRGENRQSAVQRGKIIEQFDLGISEKISEGAGTLATHGNRPLSGQLFKFLELLEQGVLRLCFREREKHEIRADLLAEG